MKGKKMPEIYYIHANVTGAVVILGEDPYSPRSQEIVAAVFRKGHDCSCQDGGEHDARHEEAKILKDRNGRQPSPRVWISGDCANAYTGWLDVLGYIEVAEGTPPEEIFPRVLKEVSLQ